MKQRVSVCAVHRDDRGNLLLARRKPGGSQGGKWEFPGGKAEEGESPEEALSREILEELGVSCRVQTLAAQTAFHHKGQDYGLFAYLVTLESLIFSLGEHEEAGWFSREEIATMDLSDSDFRIFLQLSQSGG